MFRREIVIVAITRQGVETALKIKKALDKLELHCTVYVPEKYLREGAVAMDKKVGDFIREKYAKVDGIIGVMAAGIIIRAVAPCLESKLIDPAVVAVDAAGRFAVSLLAGHYGGANHLARLVAEGIGATPVITTASEAAGKLSVDELACNLHLTIVNPESLIPVNAAIVDGKRVALILIGDIRIPVKLIREFTVEKAFDIKSAIEILSGYDAGAIIFKEPVSNEFAKPVTILKPKTITVGIGARKNITANQLLNAVHSALKRVNIPVERVSCLATVDIKRDSSAINEAAKKLGLNIEFLSTEVLRGFRHPDLSADSQIVTEKIGVGGVCERAALITAGKEAKLLLKKMKMNGVTVAVAEGE
ncbi:MAG: cobalamin biosynthesis protein [Candidatus Bathyarchaeia archaeon]